MYITVALCTYTHIGIYMCRVPCTRYTTFHTLRLYCSVDVSCYSLGLVYPLLVLCVPSECIWSLECLWYAMWDVPSLLAVYFYAAMHYGGLVLLDMRIFLGVLYVLRS